MSDYDNNLKTDTGEQLSGEPTVTNPRCRVLYVVIEGGHASGRLFLCVARSDISAFAAGILPGLPVEVVESKMVVI